MKIRVPAKLSLLLALLLVLAIPPVAFAQFGDDAAAVDPNFYGPGSNSLMIPGTAFVPSNSATAYAKPFLFLHRTGGGDSEFTHHLSLPPGALIESVTAYVHDTNATEDVTLRMCIVHATTGTGVSQDLNCDTTVGLVPVATTGTPGSTALTGTVNRTFRNVTNSGGTDYDLSHVLIVHLGAADSTTRLHSVKVQWKRQVSPAPGTASFTDVPVGSALHQYVEALVASGITAGCGGGNFCPNASVTRGQIAVFLAKALGLHWAP